MQHREPFGILEIVDDFKVRPQSEILERGRRLRSLTTAVRPEYLGSIHFGLSGVFRLFDSRSMPFGRGRRYEVLFSARRNGTHPADGRRGARRLLRNAGFQQLLNTVRVRVVEERRARLLIPFERPVEPMGQEVIPHQVRHVDIHVTVLDPA